MDPVNMDGSGVWHIDEKCLAPYLDNGELKEAVVKSIQHKEDDLSYAVVLFMDTTERKVPLRHLRKSHGNSNSWNTSIFDDEDLEKPYFPDRRPAAPVANFPLSNSGVFVPYTINRYLRDYQRDGIRFLYEHYTRSTGCILGDDMGLGKTIQVISFLAAILHKKGTREDIENNMPEFLLRTMKKKCSTESAKKIFLIVSPLSVLYNWKDELETWGYFKVAVFHGNKKDFQLGRLKQGKYEIALTTYETLRLCLDDLNSIEWSAVIVDEAHRIKNPKARVTQVMKSLRCKARIGLTGTILQNNMEELWCVIDWAVPGCFGSKSQFKEEFSNPVELGQRHNATKRELATGRKVMEKLTIKMSSLFLRRTKGLISNQLPKKEDRIVYCALSEFQKAVYQTVLETQDVSLVLRGGEKCSCRSGLKRRRCCYAENQYGESVKTLYFSYMAILRKVANHAALLQSNANTSKKQDAHIKRICSEVFSKFPEFIQQTKEAAFETISDPKYSGKMKVLQQLLNHCRKNKDKVLLFSFSTKLLDVLERYCMASGLDYRRLDGNTKPEDRVNIVKEFNSEQDVNICLVSTMAGGLGLNFVGANIVVIFDPTWNPANDLQAIDRAYRIGQCRDVKVFRLISLGTVEEMIYLRQVYKQQLHCAAVGSENAKRYFKAVQGSREHKGELFGVHNLFKLRTQGTCLTKDILEREGQVEAGIRSTTMYLNQQSLTSNTNTDEDLEQDEKNRKSNYQFQKEGFDFSSDSDDEINDDSRRKSNISAGPDRGKQLTLQQCGFSRLLEGALGNQDKKSDLPESPPAEGEHSKIKSNNAYKACKFKKSSEVTGKKRGSDHLGLNISSDEDAEPVVKNKGQILKDVMETNSSSDESDIIFPTQANKSDLSIKSSTHEGAMPHTDESLGSDFECDPSKKTRNLADSGSDYISDESDDIEIPSIPSFSKQKNTSYASRCDIEKNSQVIDAFSTSEDDDLHDSKMCPHPPEQTSKTTMYDDSNRSTKRFKSIVHRKHSRTNKDDHDADIRPVSQKEIRGSLDGILDGVAEVVYIHSNQNVVGSSKAENHMSRWAVRDVFELKQFSQLPANIAAHVPEKWEFTKEESISQKNKEEKKSPSILQYPVVHNQSQVLQVGEKMFLVGETPRSIIKRHFEQMVSYFKMDSAEELAHHLVKVKSHVRQSMLQDFYARHHTEVANLYHVHVPLPEREEDSVPKTKDAQIRLKKKRKKSHLPDEALGMHAITKSNHVEMLDIDCVEHDCIKPNKEIESPTIAEKGMKYSNTLQKKSLPSREFEIAEPHTSAEFDQIKNFPQNKSSKTKRKMKQTLSVKDEANFVSDLLGDTSILDDLFSNAALRQSAALPVRTQYESITAKSKHRSKDFWDILSEQNDESINRLTDLSVIEKVCETSIMSSVSKKEKWNDSLWVNNDKFVWKKTKTSNLEAPSSSKSSNP